MRCGNLESRSTARSGAGDLVQDETLALPCAAADGDHPDRPFERTQHFECLLPDREGPIRLARDKLQRSSHRGFVPMDMMRLMNVIAKKHNDSER